MFKDLKDLNKLEIDQCIKDLCKVVPFSNDIDYILLCNILDYLLSCVLTDEAYNKLFR